MTDIDRLDQRLSAVERVVVDGDVTLEELSELAATIETVSALEARLDEQERRMADLEAAAQSVEGYVGNVESINDDVERHAASAVATADRLERRLDKLEVELDDLQGGLLEAKSAADRAAEDFGEGPTDDRAERTTDDESKAVAATGDDVGGDETVFEFGRHGDGGRLDVEPERTAEAIIEGDGTPRSIVDDGAERPASSANQSAVDAMFDERDSSSDDPRPTDEADGLLGAIRTRLS